MNFYFNDSDIKELFNFIQLNGGKLIPDIFFPTEEYIVLPDFETFLWYQKNETTHFFLISDEYFIEPLKITKNRYTEDVRYNINQRKGGPYVDLSFYRGASNDSIIPYKRSEIDIYSKFIHLNSHDEFNATDELKKYYTRLAKYIKSKCKIVEKGGKRHWISRSILNNLNL